MPPLQPVLVFSMGGLLWLAGVLTKEFTRAQTSAPIAHPWMVVFGLAGLMLVALSFYYARMLLTGGEERKSESVQQMAETFRNVVVSFLKKPDVYLPSAFIFLYRAGEGQIIKVGPLFLQAMRANGGLGLNSKQVGTI